MKNEKEFYNKIDPNQLISAYQEVIRPITEIAEITPMKLRDVATELKQTDGEHWAVGEMLERGLNFLNAITIINKYKI